MKSTIFFILAGVLLAMSGCVKTGSHPGAASLTIVNAINNSNPIVTDFQGANGKGGTVPLQYYSSAVSIPYASSWETGSFTGPTALALSQVSDTLAIIWSGSFDLPVGSIHTLFVCGDTTALDTLFTTDYPPYYGPTDSVAGVRFVNLVAGSQPMSVNIQGSLATQTEFSNISYKGITDFKQYPGSSVGMSYVYEIRDQASGTLLVTFTWQLTPFKNNTVVICGSEAVNTQTPVAAFQINNF